MYIKQSGRPGKTKISVEALIEAFCKKGTKQVKEDLNVPRSTFDHADIRRQAFKLSKIAEEGLPGDFQADTLARLSTFYSRHATQEDCPNARHSVQ